MANIFHFISVWPRSVIPTEEQLVTGEGSAAYEQEYASTGETVTHTLSGLNPGTDYSLEWYLVDPVGGTRRATRQDFTTTVLLVPIAPEIPSQYDYRGATVNKDFSVGWQNADPTGFVFTGLPAGLSGSTGGIVTGSPTTNGDSSVTLTNTNENGSDSTGFTWNISTQPPAPTVTGSGLDLKLQLRI